MIYLKTSVGVEIREDELVISALRSNFSGAVFTDFARIGGYRTREAGELRAEVRRLFTERRLGRENVVLGLPRSEVVLRQLDFPREVEDNLKQVVHYQVQSFEPTEEDKFYHDYVVMGPRNGRLQVLVAMIKKSVLDGHLGRLEALGLRPALVTLGSVALANLLLREVREAPRKTLFFADCRVGRLELAGLRQGALVYSHAVEFASPDGWGDRLLSELDLAAAKMRLGSEDAIDEIVLAGEEAEAARADVGERLPGSYRIESHVPFETAPGVRAHVDEGAASLALAYSGMVRRSVFRLNLLPSELRVVQSRWAYVPSIVLGFIVVGLLVALGVREMTQEQIMVRKLDQEIDRLKAPVARVRTLKTQADEIEKKISYTETLLRPCDMNLEILQELTQLMPQDTFLSNYSNREGTITVSGASSSASDLIPKLERSPLLINVQQRGTVFKDAQTGKDRFTFEAKREICR